MQPLHKIYVLIPFLSLQCIFIFLKFIHYLYIYSRLIGKKNENCEFYNVTSQYGGYMKNIEFLTQIENLKIYYCEWLQVK